jgi:hypothetical protein
VRLPAAEDRADPTSGSGIRTVDVGFARGEHGDAGDRDSRHRSSAEESDVRTE